MSIPQSFIQELLNRADVVEIVGRYVQLKKAGANFSGLCPFHSEKSPSFTVSPTKQFFHCFGCGKNGNAIRFLMEHAGMNFVEAVKDLAQTYNMTVPEESLSPEERAKKGELKEQIQSLTDVLEKASQDYKKQLKNSPKAVTYLKERGLSGEIAKQFGLGYSPEGWRNLASVFPDYQSPLLVESGLVISSQEEGGEEKRYDRFRDRIMFPIRSIKGECIGFGGRVIPMPGASSQSGPKYLNSPETPVFIKGRELYGLFEARQSLRTTGYCLVTEGYMDVVALAQWGFPNAVATLGTACTHEHAQKLFRFTDVVVFSFDGDAAGQRAARKALEVSLPFASDTRSVKFLFLPKEHDPDSYIREHGQEAFARFVSNATPLSRYLMESARVGCDLDTAEGRAQFASLAKPLWEPMPQGVLKSQLLSEIATLVGIGEKELLSLWGNADPTPRYGQSPRNSSAQRSNDTQKNFKNKPGASGFTPYKGNPLSPLTSYPHRIEGANSLSNNLLTPRRKPSSRADRSVQILFSDMKQWELLSNTQQSMLCSLSAPHGELFKWLDAQYLEIGVQSWAALLEGIKEHPHNDSLLQLFKNTPPDLETTPQELSSILIEMEKDAIDKELNQLIPTANSDPLAYERVRFLNNRRAKLKSGIAV
jgi:DNA primase